MVFGIIRPVAQQGVVGGFFVLRFNNVIVHRTIPMVWLKQLEFRFLDIYGIVYQSDYVKSFICFQHYSAEISETAILQGNAPGKNPEVFIW